MIIIINEHNSWREFTWFRASRKTWHSAEPWTAFIQGPIIYIMFIEMLTDCHGHGDRPIHGDGTILILCPLSHLEHLNFHSFEVQMGENYSCYSTYLVWDQTSVSCCWCYVHISCIYEYKPANTGHPANTGFMVGQHRRRWTNIKPALVKRSFSKLRSLRRLSRLINYIPLDVALVCGQSRDASVVACLIALALVCFALYWDRNACLSTKIFKCLVSNQTHYE